MAKGRANIRVIGFALPDVDAAREVDLVDGSAAPVRYPTWAFGAAKATYIDLECECDPEFNMTRPVSLTFPWQAAADTNLAHKVRWNSYFLRIITDAGHTDFAAIDILVDGVRDQVSSQLSGSGRKTTTAEILVSNLDHALTGGDTFSLRLTRDIEHPDDDLLGDALLLGFFSVTEAM